jgi:hypothetical protein
MPVRGSRCNLAHKDASCFLFSAYFDVDESGRAFFRYDVLNFIGIALKSQRFHSMPEEMSRSLSLTAQKAGLFSRYRSFANL